MATTPHRLRVTETAELTEALDAAGRRWPGVGRPQLLVRLALEGHDAIELASETRRRRRLAAVRRHSGALTGSYGADYLERLRDDWAP